MTEVDPAHRAVTTMAAVHDYHLIDMRDGGQRVDRSAARFGSFRALGA